MQTGFSTSMLATTACATLSSTEYRVADYLVSVATNLTTTTFWHTDAMICAATNLTLNTVRKCRAVLVAAGMIDYVAGAHKGTRSRYTLHFLTPDALRHNAERQIALANQLANQLADQEQHALQPTRSLAYQSPQNLQQSPQNLQQSPQNLQQSPQNLHLLNTNSLSQYHLLFAEGVGSNVGSNAEGASAPPLAPQPTPPAENEVREYLTRRHNIPLSVAELIAVSFCSLWRFRNWRDESTGRCIIPYWHDRADGYYAVSRLRFDEQSVRLGIAIAKQEEQTRYYAQVQAERAARQARYDADYAAERAARQARQSFGKQRKPSPQSTTTNANSHTYNADDESRSPVNGIRVGTRWEMLDRKRAELSARQAAGEPRPLWMA